MGCFYRHLGAYPSYTGAPLYYSYAPNWLGQICTLVVSTIPWQFLDPFLHPAVLETKPCISGGVLSLIMPKLFCFASALLSASRALSAAHGSWGWAGGEEGTQQSTFRIRTLHASCTRYLYKQGLPPICKAAGQGFLEQS